MQIDARRKLEMLVATVKTTRALLYVEANIRVKTSKVKNTRPVTPHIVKVLDTRLQDEHKTSTAFPEIGNVTY